MSFIDMLEEVLDEVLEGFFFLDSSEERRKINYPVEHTLDATGLIVATVQY